MQTTGNKGEWSELYVFLKLLADGRLYTADGALNKQPNVFYEVVNIMRDEEAGRLKFSYIESEQNITINLNGNEMPEKTVSITEFKNASDTLLAAIKKADSASFSVPEVVNFRENIMCEKLKAPSRDKADIVITMHDPNANVTLPQGFSIKSQLGKPATLLNAGKNTNFKFKICGDFTDNDMSAINSIYTTSGDISVKERMRYLKEKHFSLSYADMAGNIFKNNLILIDAGLPEIISGLMLEYYLEGTVNMEQAVANVREKNPLNFDLSQNHPFYEYKVKKFLVDVALGLLPGTTWTGYEDANGGYIVVKEDGEVLCYHLYHRNDFEDYLLKNVRFDRGGANRHEYAKVEKENDEYFIKLNLQIRFKN